MLSWRSGTRSPRRRGRPWERCVGACCVEGELRTLPNRRTGHFLLSGNLVPLSPPSQILGRAFQSSCSALTEEHKALGEQEQENMRIVNR